MLGSARLSWIWTRLPYRLQDGFSSALCVTHSETQAKSAIALWSMFFFFNGRTAWAQEIEPNDTSAFKTSDHERQGISHIPLVSVPWVLHTVLKEIVSAYLSAFFVD